MWLKHVSFAALLEDESLRDFEIRTEDDDVVKAHAIIIKHLAPKMYREDKMLFVPEVETVWQVIVQYLYSGVIPKEFLFDTNVMNALKKYEIPPPTNARLAALRSPDRDTILDLKILSAEERDALREGLKKLDKQEMIDLIVELTPCPRPRL